MNKIDKELELIKEFNSKNISNDISDQIMIKIKTRKSRKPKDSQILLSYLSGLLILTFISIASIVYSSNNNNNIEVSRKEYLEVVAEQYSLDYFNNYVYQK